MLLSPYEVKDFSGGMTDNFLAGPPTQGELFDNLLINKNKKPFSRQGSVLEDLVNPQIPSGVARISYIWDHRDKLIKQSASHLFYITSVPAYTELTGPTGNDAFDGATTTSHISQAFWNNHSLLVCDNFCKPQKVYKDNTGALKLRNAGLPDLANSPTVTAGAAGADTYIYGFLYYYTYNVETAVFEDFGPTTQVQLTLSAAPDASTVHITNIPVLANTTVDNWDTTVIKVKIYRTEANQTTLKYIGEVTNGTTVYNDSASDASIANAVNIYTTGDVVDNDPPPPAKFVHVANDIALYGYVKEGSETISTKVRQSLKGDIDSCPIDFFDTFPDEITGISSIQGTFIVFTTKSVFRLDGFFDEQGRGGISHLKISDTVGCVSNDSIVQSDDVLFFAGNEGFYVCDGYKVTKISDHLNDTYQTLIVTAAQSRNIWGAYDKNQRRIWFGVQQDQGSLDNDSCFILDLEWGVSNMMTFTTASNGANFRPTCFIFKGNYMYRADSRGYTFKHSDSYRSDPKVNVSAAASTWNRATIIYDYKSCAFDFGTSFVRKFVSKILMTLSNISNLAVQINSINDTKSSQALKQIRHNSNVLWGDPDPAWMLDEIIWNKTGLIEEKRNFPSPGLRCNYKQIQITNAYTVVANSDTYGTATLDFAAKTMTLDNLSSTWPTYAVDYFISFEDDNYTTQFLITGRTSNTVIVFADSGGIAPKSGSYKWLVKGYRKDEAFELLSYVIHYKMLSDSQKSFQGTDDTGANA